MLIPVPILTSAHVPRITQRDPDASFESTPSTPMRSKAIQEKSPEDKAKITLKCLTMSVAMLEQVNDVSLCVLRSAESSHTNVDSEQ